MAYRVQALTEGGSVLGIIIQTPEAALAQLQSFRDGDLNNLSVKDLEGGTLDIETLLSLEALTDGHNKPMSIDRLRLLETGIRWKD